MKAEAEVDKAAQAVPPRALPPPVVAQNQTSSAADIHETVPPKAAPASAPPESVAPTAPLPSIHSSSFAPLQRRAEPWRPYVDGERTGYGRFDVPRNF